jgi:hypothetical protein
MKNRAGTEKLFKEFFPFAQPFVGHELKKRPTDKQVEEWVEDYTTQLAATPQTIRYAASIGDAETARTRGLSDKAAGVLAGLAVIGAVLAGAEVAYWTGFEIWQRLLLITSDLFTLAALIFGFWAVSPQPGWTFAAESLGESATEARDRGVPISARVAAQQLACARATEIVVLRTASQVRASVKCARNAVFVAAFVGAILIVSHLR